MVFGYTVIDQGVDGNRRFETFKITDVQNDGSSIVYTRFKKIIFADAVNQSDNADTFKASWNANGGNAVTLTSVTNDDDGILTVWGLL